MRSAQPTPGNDAYTIVIFRGSTAKPLRLSIPRHIVRKAFIAAIILILVDLAVISHYVNRTGEVWELHSLRTEVLSARQQTAAFSTAVGDLKRRMLSMKEMNQRMRVMLGIDVQKSEGDLLNGRGGEETPIEGGGMEQGPLPGVEGTETSDSIRRAAEIFNGSLPDEDIDEAQAEALKQHLKKEISLLEGQIGFQEKATERLLAEAEKRSARWDSTPSIWPVKGWVTSGFGARVSPFTGRPALHDGLDIGASPNTPVRAPAAGRVRFVGFFPKLGHIVKLDHGYGIETLYGHLNKYLVKNGQRVQRGDVIALVGSTGLSTGPHLHYAVKVRGRAVNPNQYILE